MMEVLIIMFMMMRKMKKKKKIMKMTALMMKILNFAKSLDNNGEMQKKNKKDCKPNQNKQLLHQIKGNFNLKLIISSFDKIYRTIKRDLKGRVRDIKKILPKKILIKIKIIFK